MTKIWLRRLECYGLSLLVFFNAGGFIHDVGIGVYDNSFYVSALIYLVLFLVFLYPLVCMIVRE